MAQFQLALNFSVIQIPAPIAVAKNYTITHNPLAGFKVVLAPGLTSKIVGNPCLSCRFHLDGTDKEFCSEVCECASARAAYLDSLGTAFLAGAVDATDESGQYGY